MIGCSRVLDLWTSLAIGVPSIARNSSCVLSKSELMYSKIGG
jgi:hypothetical protein